MEQFTEVAPGVRLWVEEFGDPDATPVLLIMGANASGPAWPERLITTIAEQHRVIRYDHRDTGRSTWAFDDCPYALTDLATDAVTVLDAVGAWRVAHWRVLNGTVLPFDTAEFRELEERVIAHAGTHRNPAAHARAAQGGLDRGAELAKVSTPTLVIEAPEDPANPPPHATHLAGLIPGARVVTIPGMGHALSAPVLPPLADAVLAHTATSGRFKITEPPKGSI